MQLQTWHGCNDESKNMLTCQVNTESSSLACTFSWYHQGPCGEYKPIRFFHTKQLCMRHKIVPPGLTPPTFTYKNQHKHNNSKQVFEREL